VVYLDSGDLENRIRKGTLCSTSLTAPQYFYFGAAFLYSSVFIAGNLVIRNPYYNLAFSSVMIAAILIKFSTNLLIKKLEKKWQGDNEKYVPTKAQMATTDSLKIFSTSLSSSLLIISFTFFRRELLGPIIASLGLTGAPAVFFISAVMLVTSIAWHAKEMVTDIDALKDNDEGKKQRRKRLHEFRRDITAAMIYLPAIVAITMFTPIEAMAFGSIAMLAVSVGAVIAAFVVERVAYIAVTKAFDIKQEAPANLQNKPLNEALDLVRAVTVETICEAIRDTKVEDLCQQSASSNLDLLLIQLAIGLPLRTMYVGINDNLRHIWGSYIKPAFTHKVPSIDDIDIGAEPDISVTI
jgi:hypothetical protein